ncbi:unnamed protein product, partial [Vitis vinifera]
MGSCKCSVDCHFSMNGSNRVTLEGGHIGVVRSVLPMSSKQIGTTQSQGIFGCIPFNLNFFHKIFHFFLVEIEIFLGNVKVNGKALKSKELCDTSKVEYVNLLNSIDLQNI